MSLKRVARFASAVGAILTLSVLPTGGPAGGASSFTATASARLVDVNIRLSPPIGFDPLLDPGQSVVQAQLDSLGVSQAYAANTFPGATVLGLPGLIGFATDGAVGSENIPEYPLYAQSSWPTEPESEAGNGPYHVSAQSSPNESEGRTTDSATTGEASVTLRPSSGEVVARARSIVAGLQFGDDLIIHGVRSSAEVRQAPSGELTRSSSFEVSALTILGQRVAVTPEGLAVADDDVPVPVGDAADSTLGPLLAALAEAGTTIETFPSKELEDGVSSGGLRITTPIQPPPELASGVETVTATVTIGGSIVSVSNEALPDFGGGDFTPPPTSGFSDGGVADPGGPIADTSFPSASGSSGSIEPTTPSPPAGPSTPPSSGSQPAAPVPAASVANIPFDVSAGGLYPILVVAGAVLFASARLFRYLGATSS